jgi:hypothetical protein
MVELTGEVRLPAFLCDVYSDVIAANNVILSFFKIPFSFSEHAEQLPGGYNTARFNFGRDLLARSYVGGNWDQYAANSMRSFRANSLRYRARPYFKFLMKVFRNQNEYPLFDRYWKMVSSSEQDMDAAIDSFSYHHEEFGDIKYMTSQTVSITSFGELFLVQYLPLDGNTSQLFERLAQETGPGVERFASWPDKTFPREK